MTVLSQIGRFAVDKRVGRFARQVLARPYSRASLPRYAVIYETNDISYSQVYPFVLYADEIQRRFNIELRFFTVEAAKKLDFRLIDRVFIQLWFTREISEFEDLFESVYRGGARVVAFLDSFAHNDLRLAPVLDQHIDYYLKKSLFRDRRKYHVSTHGHTNLTDFYNRAYGIDDVETQWHVPEGFLKKLRLSPNFFTAPHLYNQFLNKSVDDLLTAERDIDVHARLGVRGSPWYSTMRAHGNKAVAGLTGMNIASNGVVSKRLFNAELTRSKICFSPFGYGELCWRDVEAVGAGAILLKPNMNHLEVLPEIYDPWTTYVPIDWNFSDVSKQVAWILDNPAASDQIARTAFVRIQDYLRGDRFVDDMGFLFKDKPRISP